MIRVNYRYQIFQFFIFVILQIPLLNKFVLFQSAFGFIYVGFLIFFPFRLSPFIQLTTGFVIGLIMDMFSNTPGMHASASIFIMFIKDYWLPISAEEPEDEINTSVFTLGNISAIIYSLPLIFIHHFIIFSLEYGRWEGFGSIFLKIVWSTLLTFFSVYLINLLIAPRKRRA